MGDPRAAGLYSIEWRAAARSVLLVGCDPEAPQKRAVTQTKCNFGPPAESVGYTITSDSESPSGAHFFWTGTSDLTAERILETVAKMENSDGQKKAKEEAEEFLRDMLDSGRMHVKELTKEARDAGISNATLRRAKEALGVTSQSEGFGKDKKWYWELPKDSTNYNDAKEPIFSNDEHLKLNQTRKSNYDNNFALDAQPKANERLSDTGEHLSNGVRLFKSDSLSQLPAGNTEDEILSAIAE